MVKSEKCWIFWLGVQELRPLCRGRWPPPLTGVQGGAKQWGSVPRSTAASTERLHVHDGCDRSPDPFGGSLDFPVAEMGVTQRHADVGVTEHP